MAFELKDETLKNIAKNCGCTVEDLKELDDEDLRAIAEKKIGKSITAPANYKTPDYPKGFITMKDVDKRTAETMMNKSNRKAMKALIKDEGKE